MQYDKHIPGGLGSSLATTHPHKIKQSYSFAWHIGFWAPSHKWKNDFIRDKSIDCWGWEWGKRSSCLRNQKIDLGFQSFCWKGGKLDLDPMAQMRRKWKEKGGCKPANIPWASWDELFHPCSRMRTFSSVGVRKGEGNSIYCAELCARGSTHNISFSFPNKPIIMYH